MGKSPLFMGKWMVKPGLVKKSPCFLWEKITAERWKLSLVNYGKLHFSLENHCLTLWKLSLVNYMENPIFQTGW